MYEIGKANLKSLNDLISTNGFIFGSKASTIDAIVFAFISQIINHDNGPMNTFINSMLEIINIISIFFFFK